MVPINIYHAQIFLPFFCRCKTTLYCTSRHSSFDDVSLYQTGWGPHAFTNTIPSSLAEKGTSRLTFTHSDNRFAFETGVADGARQLPLMYTPLASTRPLLTWFTHSFGEFADISWRAIRFLDTDTHDTIANNSPSVSK